MRWCCGASSIEPAEPLTAEQLAEKKKEEAELIAAQLAKPSYWDEVGPGRPNASALKAALADTVLVDAAWLARLADEGGILPRCQDLPPGARVTLEEMEKWEDPGEGGSTLGVLVISYPWLDADHPDKDGLQLRKIAKVLKLFDKQAKRWGGAGCKVGVFLDYVSMPQRSRGSPEDDRTPEELATFKRSLQGINAWYGAPGAHVLLVDTDLPAGAHTNMQPYAWRGWCVMERKASGLVKGNAALISLKGLTGEETDLCRVRINGQAAREPPMAPAAFKAMLEAGVASGAIKFTNRGDVGTVVTIYGKAFTAEMAAVVTLTYSWLRWDDAQVRTVIEALHTAHAGGGLRKVEKLSFSYNKMGDGAAAALFALLEEGAMPNLKGLQLNDNQIGDDGVAALTSALRGGALPSCTSICLSKNQIGDEGFAAFASALRGGALPACWLIDLSDNPGRFGNRTRVNQALASLERLAAVTQNASHMAAVVKLSYTHLQWGDAQVRTLCEALRAAHAGGGLRKAEELDLEYNKIGDGAAAALATLLEEGAMPNLKRLNLRGNQIGDDGVAALASALRGGAMPSCRRIRLDGNPGSEARVKQALASPERLASVTQNAAHMVAVVQLYYLGLGWDDAQVRTVIEALRAAHAGGGLRKVEELNLVNNQMGDGAAAALAALLEEGVMPNLKELHLDRNQIGDNGVAALASALRGGALPSCTEIFLNGNQIGDDGVAALASALRGGALPSCNKIYLRGNPGSDATGVDVDSKVKEALASPERLTALARRCDEPSA